MSNFNNFILDDFIESSKIFNSPKVKRLKKGAIIPTRSTSGSAGYDLYAYFDEPIDSIAILPHETEKIGTGIAIMMPKRIDHSLFGAVFARSGLATKQGLRPANCVGVIDEDYRGEIIVALHNDSDKPQVINRGDRIAQLVIMPCYNQDFIEVDELGETDRGEGGFGSTGK